MKLLIIGGTGYLSSALVSAALEAGHEVSAVTRGQRGELPDGVEPIVVNRDDADALQLALVGREFDGAIDSICYRPEQAQAAVEVFAGSVGRYVMVSTDFVYGIGSRRVPTPESAPRDTPNPYGQAKAACEDVFLEENDRLPVSILRPPHIVGGAGLLGTGSLEGRDANLTARLKAGDPVIMLDGGSLLIQPADRRDIAAAALAAIESPLATGQVFNVAGPRAVTSREYYEIVGRLLGVTVNFLSLPAAVFQAAFPDRAVFAVHRAYDTRALETLTGWRARVSLEESLNEMVENRLRQPQVVPEKSEALANLVSALVQGQAPLEALVRQAC